MSTVKAVQWQVRAKDAKKLVLPLLPVFDKIVAALLVCRLQGKPSGLEDIPLEFREDQHPTNKTWERWEAEQAMVIDVGAQKYQLQERGSATEVLAALEPELLANPITEELVQMTVRNNAKGNLKAFPHSVVYILREIYKMNDLCTNANDRYDKREIVMAVGQVVRFWIRAQETDMRQRWAERTEKTLLECEELRELMIKVGTDFAPFTVQRYARDLWMCGFSPEKIMRECSYFLTAEEDAKGKMEDCSDVFFAAERRVFGWKRAILVRTNHVGVGRWCLKNQPYDVVVIRRDKSDPRDRNVVILTRDNKDVINLQPLANLLISLERHAQEDSRGRWYYDTRINALLNGTTGHGVPATYLIDDVIVRLLEWFLFDRRPKTDDDRKGLAQMIANTQPESKKIDMVELESLLMARKPLAAPKR